MPAHLPGAAADGSDDLVGMKWVAGFATNNALGLPAINAVVVLNDAGTGLPVAILDGGPITAERTAAVSGVAIRRFAPQVAGRPVRAALIGGGVQGHSHVPVLGHVLPGVELTVFDRHPERAEALASEPVDRGDRSAPPPPRQGPPSTGRTWSSPPLRSGRCAR